ncbi:MAG TPA: hypothetical protein VGP72_25195 [Planctomycetota bacterium]|jgi:hypothetical protein
MTRFSHCRLFAASFIALICIALHAETPMRVQSSEGTAAGAKAIVKTYREIPKGVVLEGVAEGIDALTEVDYDKEKDEFIINNKMRYKNPLSRKEWVQVYKAVQKDDRMGVTLLDGEPHVYGPLSSSSSIVKSMVETDRMLGGIIYGIERLLEGVKLPGDYKPKRATDRKIAVVAFARFTDFAFEKVGEKYQLGSCLLDVQLIPLSEQKTQTGGHLPDNEKMKEYVMEDSDRENIDHIRKFQPEYLKMPDIAKSAAAGEAAAFARFVRDSKVKDAALLKSMN